MKMASPFTLSTTEAYTYSGPPVVEKVTYSASSGSRRSGKMSFRVTWACSPGATVRLVHVFEDPDAASLYSQVYVPMPAEMRADARIYPPAATLARCDWLKNRGSGIENIEAIWREVRA